MILLLLFMVKNSKQAKLSLIYPTLDTYLINTNNRGDFSQILQLINFAENDISEKDFYFFSEVLKILGNDKILVNNFLEEEELTNDNVFIILSKSSKFYLKKKIECIEFISSNFFNLCQTNQKEFFNLQEENLLSILNSPKLKLKDENQLLQFINGFYKSDKKYSYFYEFVCFENVSSTAIKEFLSIFDINDITNSIWLNLSSRLELEVDQLSIEFEAKEEKNDHRYKREHQIFSFDPSNHFSGIINYLRKQSRNQIKKIVTFSCSSLYKNDDRFQPINVSNFENQERFFASENIKNSWICLDFNDHKIELSHYSIKSVKWDINYEHPKSWVIEGSNEALDWTVLDEQINCSLLNGRCIAHTFEVNKNNSKKFRYIRMRLTDKNWRNTNNLVIDSFEVYGKFI